MDKSKWGVHASHCCALHGCKYGDKDCPVFSGEIKQEYTCESYDYDGIKSVDEIENILKRYNIYEVASKMYYTGIALISAKTADEANEIIDKEFRLDTTNKCDRWGWNYVSEDDIIENLFSDKAGIIYNGIHYIG